MCRVCDQCREMSVQKAMKLIALELKTGGPRECLDKTLGELIGVKEPGRDLEAEEAWECSKKWHKRSRR